MADVYGRSKKIIKYWSLICHILKFGVLIFGNDHHLFLLLAKLNKVAWVIPLLNHVLEVSVRMLVRKHTRVNHKALK